PALLLGLLPLAGLHLAAGQAHAGPTSTVPAESAPQNERPDELAALVQRVAALESALESLREEYHTRLTAVEEELAALKAAPAAKPTAGDAALSDEERAALEKELAAMLGEAGAAAAGSEAPQVPASTGERRFTGRARRLNQLNPEVSVTADTFGTFADRSGDPEANQFRFAEFELALQAPLDPFSLAKAFVVQEEGEFEVEEAYIDWTSLPGGMGFKFGEYRHDWAKLNRWHQHALPQADRPLVHQAIFGEEGLKGLGVSLSWMPPAFLGSYNEVWFQVTNDENEVAFSGRGYDDPVFTVHETNYWDLSTSSYFELGLSAATGVHDEGGRFRTQVYGIDWNFDWRPPARALYKGLEVRGELLWERREETDGVFDSVGAYTYATYKLNRRWYLGLRADWTELPEEPGEDLWGVSPYVEWWQSEWARMRFQYSRNSRQLEEPESENKFFFQITWSLGPHKHEKY
ncbi:MAG: hypothetical protein ACE5JI_05785, partial [Acidobacteriota bacterium]